MTKLVRIENADLYTSGLKITAQYLDNTGVWVDEPKAPRILQLPCSQAEFQIHSHRRLIVEEFRQP